jgi:hypothetical protein
MKKEVNSTKSKPSYAPTVKAVKARGLTTRGRKKKKEIKINNLSKFQGNTKVKVFKKFLHLGLCELKRQRTTGPWKKMFKYGNIQITLTGAESINMYDKGILLAVLKAAQDKKKEVLVKQVIQKIYDNDNEENNSKLRLTDEIKTLITRKGKPDETIGDMNKKNIHRFYTFSIKFNEFCNKYAKVGRQRRTNVYHSIKRLWGIQTIHEEIDKTGKIVDAATFSYIVSFSLHDGVITFTLSNMLIESCEKGLLVSYDFFLSLKTEIAKSLYLFFMGNVNNTFTYKTIKDAMSLDDEDKQNRALIKQGLKSLKESKFLKDFKIENRENDTFYILTYDILNNDNKIADLTDITTSEPAILQDDKKGVTHGDKTVTHGDKTVTHGDKTVTHGDKTVTHGEGVSEIV